MGRTAPPEGASICINPITFSPVHGTVLAPIYHTERCLLRYTSRANALTIQNFPTSVQELSSTLTILTFKLSNQITLQQPVDTTAISRTESTSVAHGFGAQYSHAIVHHPYKSPRLYSSDSRRRHGTAIARQNLCRCRVYTNPYLFFSLEARYFFQSGARYYVRVCI